MFVTFLAILAVESGLWKYPNFILAQGQVNGHNVLEISTCLKEQIMQKNLTKS